MSNANKNVTVQVTFELVDGVNNSCQGCIFDTFTGCKQANGLDCGVIDDNHIWKIKQEKDNAN